MKRRSDWDAFLLRFFRNSKLDINEFKSNCNPPTAKRSAIPYNKTGYYKTELITYKAQKKHPEGCAYFYIIVLRWLLQLHRGSCLLSV